MGHTRHHAIVVTGYDDQLSAAREKAVALFGEAQVTPILPVATNGWRTFFIGPDGSKEGWEQSRLGDDAREHFVEVLVQLQMLRWAEIQYGDDDRRTLIVRHSEEGLT